MTLKFLGSYKSDHAGLVAASLVFAYGGVRLRRTGAFFLPFVLTIVLYDSQRLFADTIRLTVHVREPYLFDLHFFGIRTAQGVLTPGQWLQAHLHPILDLLCGLAYLIFVPVYLFMACYFYFYLGRTGTRYFSPAVIRARCKNMMWAFFWLNIVGFSTYYWYPAAPPWYVDLYGMGPARLDVAPNLAGCARFDQLLGLPIFSAWYGRSADVFGAIPSLHIAYPLLAVFYAFRVRSLRMSSSAFFIWICFAALYLNHHYVLDILWGAAYALGIGYLVERVAEASKVRHV